MHVFGFIRQEVGRAVAYLRRRLAASAILSSGRVWCALSPRMGRVISSQPMKSGCTKEACTFRDLKTEYDALNCVVLAVSADDEASHIKFIEKLGLNFSVLADTDKTLVKAYGATRSGDKIERRTVLVDKEGKVSAAWNPVTTAETHPNDVLAKLKEIS